MNAYQSGIAKFEENGAQVFGISTDNVPTLRHWTDEHLKTTFALLSDFQRTASQAYGILSPGGTAGRTTFVIDKEGKIQHIEEGSGAIDPTGASNACSRLKN